MVQEKKLISIIATSLVAIFTSENFIAILITLGILLLARLIKCTTDIIILHRKKIKIDYLFYIKNILINYAYEIVFILLLYFVDDVILHNFQYIHLANFLGAFLCLYITYRIYLNIIILNPKEKQYTYFLNVAKSNIKKLTDKYGIDIPDEQKKP